MSESSVFRDVVTRELLVVLERHWGTAWGEQEWSAYQSLIDWAVNRFARTQSGDSAILDQINRAMSMMTIDIVTDPANQARCLSTFAQTVNTLLESRILDANAKLSDALAGADRLAAGSTACFDADGNFLGHEPLDSIHHEHRTVGEHRAWCFRCTEWCYPRPDAACIRCRHPEEEP